MKTGDRYDLGVLFVHGIGNQKRGQHLVEMGEALTRWLERWIRAEETGQDLAKDRPDEAGRTKASTPGGEESRPGARILNARLTGDAEPARAEMKVAFPGAVGEEEASRWLLAESHWADEFLPPSFVGLCRWGLYAVPWTLALHLGGRVRRIWRRAKGRAGPLAGAVKLVELVRILVLLAALPVLAAVAMLVILALLLLALLPIPWLRRWLGAVQRTLAGTVGDSLVLLESPIQAAAIVGRTVRDIEWIAARCRRVAIVAHSQGAAVAHEALATGVLAGRYRKDHLLFTYGSGLAKLEGLRSFQAGRSRWAGWIAPGALLLCLASLVAGGWLGRGLVAEPSPWAGGYFGLVSLGMFWLGVRDAMAATRLGAEDAERLNPAHRFGIGLRWCDHWATADPVPGGSLFDEGECPPYLVATEDVNLGSMWRDHTAYHRNPDGFLAGLARELTRLAGLDLVLRDGDGARLRLGRYRRAFRVRALATVRQVLTVSVIAVPLALWASGASARLGRWVLERLGVFAGSLPVGLSKLVQPVERIGADAVGVAAVVLTVLAAYGFVVLIWLRLDWIDRRAFFRRDGYRLGDWWRLWSVAAGAFGAAMGSAILEPFRPASTANDGLAFTYWIYLGLVFLVSFFGLGVARLFDRSAWRRVLRQGAAWGAPFRLLDELAGPGFLLRVAERTVWAYAVTVAPALALWWVLPQGTPRGEVALVGAVVSLAIAGVVGVGWAAGIARSRVTRLAALGEPEAALSALEPEPPASALRGASLPPAEARSPPGPG